MSAQGKFEQQNLGVRFAHWPAYAVKVHIHWTIPFCFFLLTPISRYPQGPCLGNPVVITCLARVHNRYLTEKKTNLILEERQDLGAVTLGL